jgi:hypothetical protein
MCEWFGHKFPAFTSRGLLYLRHRLASKCVRCGIGYREAMGWS